MAYNRSKIYTITVENDAISFYQRERGSMGRDIAAVKLALEEVYYAEIPNTSPEDVTIGEAWFDCETNRQITPEALMTFDKKLRKSLMSFQIKNQFLIYSYYFEKFYVRTIGKPEDLPLQLESMINRFDMEFGTIDEATIAILHGWRPTSVSSNKSFITDTKSPVDKIPKLIFDFYTDGVIAELEEGIIARTWSPSDNSDANIEIREIFDRTSPTFKNWEKAAKDAEPVFIEYIAFSTRSNQVESDLYLATSEMLKYVKDIAEDETLSRQSRERLASITFEPNYLLDPDPFEISQYTIGFFDRTSFTFRNLPDFVSMPDSTREELESMALDKVLNFYQLSPPEIEETDPTLEEGFDDLEAAAQQSAKAEFASIVANKKSEYIKFIEFRIPSLRPGDVYRAYFEIDRKKLEALPRAAVQAPTATITITDSNQARLDSEIKELSDQFCADESGMTDEEVQAQYERYRSFASKKKLEISRRIKKAVLDAQRDSLSIDGVEADLGPFGKMNLSENEIKGLLTEGTSAVLSGAGSIATSIYNWAADAVTIKDGSEKVLKINYLRLEECIEQVAKNFDLADKDLKNFEVEGDANFSAKTEAAFLRQIPAAILTAIKSNKYQADQLEIYSLTPDSVLQDERTEIQFLFEGPTSQGSVIEKINLSYPNGPELRTVNIYDSPVTLDASTGFVTYDSEQPKGQLSGVLKTRERTIHYLRNIKKLCPGFNPAAVLNLDGTCDDPVNENPGKAAGYITTYTIGISKKKKKDEYQPFHNFMDPNPLTDRELEDNKPTDNSAWFKQATDEDWNSVFGYEQAIPMVGPNCFTDERAQRELMQQIINTFNLKRILCEYVQCIGIPAFQLQLPNINLDVFSWPDIPTIKVPGLDTFKQLGRLIVEIIQRALCTLIKGILDILRTPFCNERFAADLYGAGSPVSPTIQKALVDGMFDLGLPKAKTENAKNLIDALSSLLTPNELCALLSGTVLSTEVYHIVSAVAATYGLELELENEEQISNFFSTLGIFADPDLCEELSKYAPTQIEDCSDLASIINQIRDSILRGDDVSEDQLEGALEAAEKNFRDKGESLKFLASGGGLEDLLPNLSPFGDDSAFAVPMPAVLDSAKFAAESSFEIVKLSFVSSINSFVSSLYLETPGISRPGDDTYDSEANLILQRAVSNLSKFASVYEGTNINLVSPDTTETFRDLLLILCDDYEKVDYQSPDPDFETYKIYVQKNVDYDPNTSAQGLLQGSFIEKYNMKSNYSGDPKALSRVSELGTVFANLFPISVGDIDEKTRTLSGFYDWNKSEFRGIGISTNDTVTLNTNYLNKINQLLEKLQKDIADVTNRAINIKSDSTLLGPIKDFYDIQKERYTGSDVNRPQQLIEYGRTSQSISSLTLRHPVLPVEVASVRLREDMITLPQGPSIISTVNLNDDFFYRTNPDDDPATNPGDEFTDCLVLPSKYRTEDLSAGREDIFGVFVKNSLKELYTKYGGDESIFESVHTHENSNGAKNIRNVQYWKTSEGLMEQLVDLVDKSRIFTDPEYLINLNLKLRSKFYFDKSKGCFRNPNSLLKYGVLNFENLFTEEFESEYLKEYAKPENSVLFSDFSQPGAFEKAMMNLAVRGFVRMCLVEILLKGAVTFSVWDIDFVKGDKIFREYLVNFVQNQFEREPFFQNNRARLDETLTRTTGTNNIPLAIKALVLRNLDTVISDLSKNLFDNDGNINHYEWFLDNIPLLSIPEKKIGDSSIWKTALADDTMALRKLQLNNFVHLEEYLRINGPIRSFRSSKSEIASAQYQSLILRLPEIIDVVNKTNLDVLDVTDYSIDSPNSIRLSTANIEEEEDAYPNTEVLSVNDFHNLIKSLIDNNPELSRYMCDLTKKIYSPGDMSRHGMPKTLETRSPKRAVIRRYRRYEFSKNIFNPQVSYLSVGGHNRFASYRGHINKFRADKGIDGCVIPDTTNTLVTSLLRMQKTYGADGKDESACVQQIEEALHNVQTYENDYYIMFTNLDDIQRENIGGFPDVSEEEFLAVKTNAYGSANKGKLTRPGKWEWQAGNESEAELTLGNEHRINYTNDEGVTEPVFENTVGFIASEERFNEILDDIDLPVEYWDHMIIDMTGDGSPIFNQPGNSNFNPANHLTGQQTSQIRSLLDAAALYHKTETREKIRQHEVDVGPGVEYGTRGFPDSGVSDFEDYSNYVLARVAGGQPYGVSPVRGMGHRSPAKDTTSRQRQYTYAKTHIEPIRNASRGTEHQYQIGEQELLGLNDYKVPLRIMITQISDSDGNIKAVFARYILPKFLNFKDRTESANTYKADTLFKAIKKCIEGYIDFCKNIMKKTLAELSVSDRTKFANYKDFLTRPSDIENSDIDLARLYPEAKRALDLAEPPDDDPSAARHDWGQLNLLTYVAEDAHEKPYELLKLGMNTPGNNPDRAVPPLMRGGASIKGVAPEYTLTHTRMVNTAPSEDSVSYDDSWVEEEYTTTIKSEPLDDANNSGYYPSFLSVSKMFSIAAQISAEEKDGYNFDTSKSAIKKLLATGKRMGFLVRTRTPAPSSPWSKLTNDLSPDTWHGAVLDLSVNRWGDDNVNNSMKYELYRHLRLQTHGLYQDRLFDSMDSLFGEPERAVSEPARRVMKDFGVLVSWYGQRRWDSFFGDTNSEGPEDVPALRQDYDPSEFDPTDKYFHWSRFDNPRWACGPSLFYGDGRQSLYSLALSKLNVMKDSYWSTFLPDDRPRFEALVLYYIRRRNAMDDIKKDVNWLINAGEGFAEIEPTFANEKLFVVSNIHDYVTKDFLPELLKYQFGVTIPDYNQLDRVGRSAFEPVSFEGEEVDEDDDTRRINFILPTWDKSQKKFYPYSIGHLTDEDAKKYGLLMYESETRGAQQAEVTLQKVLQSDLELRSYRTYHEDIAKNIAKKVLPAISRNYQEALNFIGLQPLLDSITYGYTSELSNYADRGIIGDILEDSNIKYGIRVMLNVKTGGNAHLKELFKDTIESSGRSGGPRASAAFEERLGRTFTQSNQSAYLHQAIPISSFEADLRTSGCPPELISSPEMFRELLSEKRPIMKTSLMETESFKEFFEIIVPYRTYGTMLSMHGTTMTAGFGEVPNILSSAKTSMASLFETMSKIDPIGGNYGINYKASDFSSAYQFPTPAGGEEPDCFDFPNIGQWWKMIAEMIKQYIKYFPSVILRGIADSIDPAYKEMKRHYLACEIGSLNNSGWAAHGGDGNIPLALRGSRKGRKKYVPVVPGFPVDVVRNIFKFPNPRPLARTIDRFVTYIYSGPMPLADPTYAFKIPCLSIDQESPDSWKRFEYGNHGRYGHPLSPLTLLALSTYQLPGDIDLKNSICFSDPQRANAIGCEDEIE